MESIYRASSAFYVDLSRILSIRIINRENAIGIQYQLREREVEHYLESRESQIECFQSLLNAWKHYKSEHQ